MEQVVMIEQQQFDLSTMITQIQEFGKSVIITNNGKPIAKLSAVEEKPKRQLNFGFMNEEFDVPDDFDRMNID